MKNNIRKIIGILLAGVVLMYLWTGVALADTAPINFDSFEDMTSTTNNTSTTENNTVETNNTTNNTTSNTTNNAVSNSTRLPQTGSNTEIIFIIGITVLAGTAITLYNKTKIK